MSKIRKAEILAEYALMEYRAGKTITLEEYARKHKIPLKRKPRVLKPVIHTG